MDGRLLFIIFIYSFSETQAALPPPKLTADQTVITEADSVTLNCFAQPSVSVSQYYYYAVKGGTVRQFPNLQTLTGSELLKMDHQKSPAEVNVRCFYTVWTGDRNLSSPHSDSYKITIKTLPQPKLTVDPAVITEADSVRLDCQAPSSLSVSQCYYYTLKGGTVKTSPCQQTLTGSELLETDHQKSPAEVNVTCFYTVQTGGRNTLSPHSDSYKITVKTLPQPKLTVDPAVITEADSVRLDCQAPSSLSVSQCYYYTLKGGTVKTSPCQQTLTGSELLEMDHQKSAAEVQVRCSYTVRTGDRNTPSPHSDFYKITVKTLPQPKLRVNPAVITEADSVRLDCQAPSSLSVSQCYYYTLKGGIVKNSPCQQTLTGSELLEMDHQKSPAEVKVGCYYTVQIGDRNIQSPQSDIYKITVKTLPQPKLTVDPAVITEAGSVRLDCQAPSSLSVFQCYYYTLKGGSLKNSPCQQTLTGSELLEIDHQKSAAEVQVRCYYTVQIGDRNIQSRHSDVSSIIVQTVPWMLMLVISVTGCGVLGVIILVSALIWNKRRAALQLTGDQSKVYPASCPVTTGLGSSPPTTSNRIRGFEEVKRRDSEKTNSALYHLYFTIPDTEAPTAASADEDMMYSTIQPH